MATISPPLANPHSYDSMELVVSAQERPKVFFESNIYRAYSSVLKSLIEFETDFDAFLFKTHFLFSKVSSAPAVPVLINDCLFDRIS